MELGVTRRPVFPIGDHEDCTMHRVARSKVARRTEQFLRRLHVRSEVCRVCARAAFEKRTDVGTAATRSVRFSFYYNICS
jgi:hypothetical protein